MTSKPKEVYSTVCNGHVEANQVDMETAMDKFVEVFHQNDKRKHVALHRHLVDRTGNIFSTKIILQVTGRPNLPRISGDGKPKGNKGGDNAKSL